MKHTILGFQQDKLIGNNLKIDDALLLRVIKDMYSSASMEFIIENSIRYMWINYTYLLSQIPIIGCKRNLMSKIERFSNDLFLLRLLKKERKGVKGNFSYIAPTQKLDALQDYDLVQDLHNPYEKFAQPLMKILHNKDSSLYIDSSIKDTKDIGKTKKRTFSPPTVEEVGAYILEKNYSVNPETFVNFYESKGWYVGKNKMKNWQAAVRTWEQKEKQQSASKKNQWEDDDARRLKMAAEIKKKRANGGLLL